MLAGVRARAEMVADALGLNGVALLEALMHAESADLVLIEANAIPDIAPSSDLYQQVLSLLYNLLPSTRGLLVLGPLALPRPGRGSASLELAGILTLQHSATHLWARLGGTVWLPVTPFADLCGFVVSQRQHVGISQGISLVIVYENDVQGCIGQAMLDEELGCPTPAELLKELIAFSTFHTDATAPAAAASEEAAEEDEGVGSGWKYGNMALLPEEDFEDEESPMSMASADQ